MKTGTIATIIFGIILAAFLLWVRKELKKPFERTKKEEREERRRKKLYGI